LAETQTSVSLFTMESLEPHSHDLTRLQVR